MKITSTFAKTWLSHNGISA